MPDLVIYRFQPDIMKEETLRKLFVGRKALLERMVHKIEKAVKNRTPRYYLIEGPRGIGKSHFITLLYYELKRRVNEAIHVKLSEEEFSVYRVSDLFVRVLEEIEKKKNLDKKFVTLDDEEVTELILEEIKSKKKMIVLFIENLNQIFGEQMEKNEVKKLRSIFQEENIFIVVATSPLLFTEISEGQEPFYNFFEVIHLKEFKKEEIKKMIKKIADLEGNKNLENIELYSKRIDSVIVLTGGSPRIVILLYDLITKGRVVDIERAFFKILDEYTPYYQDMFKLLKGQKRRIFDILISIRRPATPKEIAKKARLDKNTVITQLRRLEKDGYVKSHKIGKNTKYEVRERLFRLWREMRQPFGKERISILIEFLKLWYTPEEREREFKDILSSLEKQTDIRSVKRAKYFFWSLPEESKIKFISQITKEFYEIGKPKLLEEFLATEGKKLKDRSIIEEFRLLIEKERYQELLDRTEEMIKKNKKDGNAWIFKGFALGILRRYEEALEAFNKAIKINPELAIAHYSLGILLSDLKRYKEAEEEYREAIKINPEYVEAHYNLGILLFELKRYKEAEKAFDKALEIDPNDNEILFGKAEVHLKISIQQIERNNYGNATENLISAINCFSKFWKDNEEQIKEMIIEFFKELMDMRQIKPVKISLETILNQRKDLKEFLEPIIIAVEIVETRNIKKYYDLQVEERELVADIVKNLTGSEELLPEEYIKNRDNF